VRTGDGDVDEGEAVLRIRKATDPGSSHDGKTPNFLQDFFRFVMWVRTVHGEQTTECIRTTQTLDASSHVERRHVAGRSRRCRHRLEGVNARRAEHGAESSSVRGGIGTTAGRRERRAG
jgi:hypothetical protein